MIRFTTRLNQAIVWFVAVAMTWTLSTLALASGTRSARNQAQKEAPSPDPDAVLPLERVGDPPGTNPREHEAVRGGTVVTRGPFRSSQVNVNESGNNIPGDAANEPSIAIDPTDPDRMAIGWRQFDTVSSNFREAGWGYSQDGGETWTFPGVLTPGTFRSDPVLASDSNGVFFYYSLKGNFFCDTFISTDGGQTWGSPIPAQGGDKAWTTIDRTAGPGAGNFYIDWSQAAGCCDLDTFTRSTDGGLTYDTPQESPGNILWGTLDVGSDGALYLCGRSPSSSSDLFVAKSTNAQDPLQTTVFDQIVQVDLGGGIQVATGPNPAGLLGQMWVAVDPTEPDRVYALASVDPSGPDPLDVMFSRSLDGGLSWSAPVRLNDDGGTSAYQWFGTLSVAPNGRLDAIWNDTRNAGPASTSEVFYSYSNDNGATWSMNLPVTPSFDHSLGYPNQNKLGDYYHAVSDDAAMNLAFAATFNGEQDVFYLRLGDCDENGIHDSEDIAAGTSRDCDGNLIPDGCDIASGTAIDDNQNGVIDSCELVLTEPDPGQAGAVNSITVTGATPNTPVEFWVGKRPGFTDVSGCSGIRFNIDGPRIARAVMADQNGEISVSGFVQERLSGRTILLQVVEPSSCNMSNLVEFTFP